MALILWPHLLGQSIDRHRGPRWPTQEGRCFEKSNCYMVSSATGAEETADRARLQASSGSLEAYGPFCRQFVAGWNRSDRRFLRERHRMEERLIRCALKFLERVNSRSKPHIDAVRLRGGRCSGTARLQGKLRRCTTGAWPF